MDKKKTILIVDDMEINRAILIEIFKDDYNIIEAYSGKQAIETINCTPNISTILLDLIMPETNGLEVLKAMNVSGKIKTIPVFLFDAVGNYEMSLEGYHLGAVDIITKPFIAQFLKHKVNNMIELYEYRNNLE